MSQTTIKNRQIAGGLDGWIPAEETWTYASADDPTYTFTIAADVTAKYSVGMKLKLTQTTVKYFIITAVSTYSGGNTTITVYGGTDYDLADAAISANYYSMVRSPFGFPMSPAKWSVIVTDTTTQSQANPSQNVWYNLGSITISIPIGVWDLYYSVCLGGNSGATAATIGLYATLSTANNSESSLNNTVRVTTGTSSSEAEYPRVNVGKSFIITAASKTSYYLNTRVTEASVGFIYNVNASAGLEIRATCAYL